MESPFTSWVTCVIVKEYGHDSTSTLLIRMIEDSVDTCWSGKGNSADVPTTSDTWYYDGCSKLVTKSGSFTALHGDFEPLPTNTPDWESATRVEWYGT